MDLSQRGCQKGYPQQLVLVCVWTRAGGEGRVPGAEETQGSSTVLMSLKPEVAKGVVPMAVDGKGRFVKPERA